MNNLNNNNMKNTTNLTGQTVIIRNNYVGAKVGAKVKIYGNRGKYYMTVIKGNKFALLRDEFTVLPMIGQTNVVSQVNK